MKEITPLVSEIRLEAEDGSATVLKTNRCADYWSARRFEGNPIEITYLPSSIITPVVSVVSVRLCRIDEKIREFAGGDMEVYTRLLSVVENMPRGKISGLISQEGNIGDHLASPGEENAKDLSMSSLEELKAKFAVLHSKYTASRRARIESLMSRFDSADGDERSRIMKQLAFYVNFINGADLSVLTADVSRIRDELDRRFIGQAPIKDLLCRALAKYQNDPLHRAPRFALTGRRGRDMERLILEFCSLSGLKTASFSCAGLYDVAPIVGSSTVYSNATVGSFAEMLSTAGQGAMLIKDIDKIKSDDVLLAFQPLVSGVYKNELLASDVDTSSVWVFFTAENCDRLACLDSSEMTVMEACEYSDEEMIGYVDFWKERFEEENGRTGDGVTFSEEVKEDIALKYSRAGNVLHMKTIVWEIMSRIPEGTVRVEREDLPEYYTLLRDKESICASPARTALGVRNRFILCRDEMDPGVRERVAELLDDYDNASAEDRKKIEKKLVDLGNLRRRSFSEGLVNLNEVKKKVYGMDKPLDTVADQIWAHEKNPANRLTPIILSGPAGVGKTLFADAVAEALGVPVIHIPFNQITDPREISGFPELKPGLLGSLCAKNVSSLSAVVIIDELDKPGVPALHNVLYNIFDQQNARDAYYECMYSTDDLLFICTANDLTKIPYPLLNRCRVAQLRSYSRREALTIAKDYISPRIRKELGCEREIQGDILALLVDRYNPAGGVRDLERCIDTLYKRASRKAVLSGKEPEIDEFFVRDCLGKPLVPRACGKMGCGRVTALAVCGDVGTTIDIEVCGDPSKRSRVTGLAKGSYLESAELARNVASRLLGEDTGSVFVHSSPAGIEKEGPSAGTALLAALLSYKTGLSLPDTALTGELKAYGEIAPVGGFVEKLRAAAAAGIRKVYVPRENFEEALAEGCLDDQGMEVVPVSDVGELVGGLFPGMEFHSLKEEGRKLR
ncbi:MAG: AAA family ATPase [Firmicutes bacterium]|nr:AAA family ATPase [Bacillota bacterium]